MLEKLNKVNSKTLEIKKQKGKENSHSVFLIALLIRFIVCPFQGPPAFLFNTKHLLVLLKKCSYFLKLVQFNLCYLKYKMP